MPWTSTTTRATGFKVTAAVWNDEHVNNMTYLEEVGYAQITASVTPTATTEATANAVVSLGAITYEAVPHMVEFYSPSVRPDNAAANRTMSIILADAGTSVGILAVQSTPAANNANTALHCMYQLTPTAASHTYGIEAFVNAGTGNIAAGAGGAAASVPAFIRITRVPG